MKSIKLFIIASLGLCLNSFAQYDKTLVDTKDIMFELHGTYTLPILKEKLKDVKTLNDLITSYPSSWINSYVSVEVLALTDGKSIKSEGLNDKLTKDQQKILKSAEIGTDIVINTIYKSKNAVSNAMETSKMTYSFTIVPEVEAEFENGKKSALTYLEQKGTEILPNKIEKGFRVTIRFTINEEGKMINARIVKPSHYNKLDTELLQSVINLNKWHSAKNAKGEAVKQDFVFTVGYYGC